ncbi:MAG: GH3 auxin-responsive promoter family protein [Candidatus Thorarchaeota archaeon]|nr:MAG: GH3 auxin-responsive promoter family protein [Candidatus Thorarchaeota archaeon]
MSVMRRLVRTMAKRKAREIHHVLENSVELTESKLKSIVEKNQDTVFGRKHRFGRIRSPEEYAESVPLCDSVDMTKWLSLVYENPTGRILTEESVEWYLMSSGTTGKPKKIPVTKTGMTDTKTGSMYGWLAFLNAEPGNDSIIDGTMVTFGAPSRISEVKGIPVGYASGVYGEKQNKVFQRLIKPGPDVFNITDNEAKMWEYAKLIATSKTTVIQGITTLSLALIRRLQNEYGPELVREYNGTKHEDRIRNAMNDDQTLNLRRLCPDLKMLGSSGIDVGPYRTWLQEQVPGLKIWEFYGLSEAGIIGTQNYIEPGIQLLGSLNYLEFIRQRDSEKEHPEAIPLSDVKKNERYEIVVTSENGWYRYRPGDLVTFVEVSPFSVRQIARKGRVVNMAGEKMAEAHVAAAIKAASAKTNAQVMDYTVVGSIEHGLPFYTLAAMFSGNDVDPLEFVAAFEDNIKYSNMEFKIVRESGALGPTRLLRMRRSLAEEVVRESHAQAKPVPLTTDTSVLALCEEA